MRFATLLATAALACSGPTAPARPCTRADTVVVRPAPRSWRVEVCGVVLCTGDNDDSSDAQARAICGLLAGMP